MALATNTATGTIKLAGDLAGNNDATAPELTSTGAISGEYYIPIITVDDKGRITNIASTDSTTVIPFLPDATNSSKGIVQIDDTNGLVITAGVLSFDTSTLPDATSGVKGVVQIDDTNGLVITAGVLSFDNSLLDPLPDATSGVKGVVQIDDTNGLVISGGQLSFNLSASSIQDATSAAKGVVQIDDTNGLVISGGVLSFDTSTLPDATNTTKGIVQIDDTNGLVVTAGVLSFDTSTLPDATSAVKGIVQIDDTNGLVISGGVLSFDTSTLPDATNTTKGVVQIDDTNGLTVAAGVLGVSPATNTTFGTVKSTDINNITITAGAIDVGTNVALKDQDNAFTKTQSVAVNTLTYSANITPDGAVSNVMEVTLTGNTTLENPTNLIAGAFYSVQITQDTTGSRTMGYGTAFKFKGGVTPTLSTAGNSIDILTCISDGTNLYSTLTKDLS